jgi:hypothetical protein
MFTPDPARTAGQNLAGALRYYHSAGTRTRRYRASSNGTQDLHHDMIEAIMLAAQYPGWHGPGVEQALRPGYGTALAYEKHVRGCRIDGTLAYKISKMTAWQFSGLLGQMVDAGVETTGAGELFFSQMARSV